MTILRPRTRRLATRATLLLALLAPLPCGALLADETTRPAELKQLPIEELLDVQVTSVTKRAETVGHTAAAISVLTREQIRRTGARTLADVLRYAAGLQVARFDSRTWSISTRGMNAQTANKMLVLIDGRSVYTPLFSGVFWDVQVPMLEDVERIEVIRGPAATLWGANAVNGVINVITAAAAATQGGLAYAGAGSEERAFGGARWGGAAGAGAYRVFAQYDDHDALVLPDGRSAGDPFRIAHGGFRLDLPLLAGDTTIQGDVYGGRIGHRIFGDSDVDGGDLQGRWRRTTGGGSQLEVRWFVDHTFRDVPGEFREDRTTGDLEAQQRWLHGRHDLLWGVGNRSSRDRVGNTPLIAFLPANDTERVTNAFVQDQMTLGAGWRLIGGLRLEDQSYMSTELLPALTLAYDRAPGTTFWLGSGRAVRAPSRIDRDVVIPGTGTPLIVGDKDFQPEELTAFELGARLTPRADLLVEATLFDNEYDHLRSQEPQAGIPPLVIGNGLRARSRGGALTLTYDPAPWVDLQLHGTWLDSAVRRAPGSHDITGGSSEAADPRGFGFLRASFDLPAAIELDGTLRHVGRIGVLDVPAYTELDLRLAHRLGQRLTLSVVGQNLLHAHHAEMGPPTTREEVQRGVYGEVSCTF